MCYSGALFDTNLYRVPELHTDTRYKSDLLYLCVKQELCLIPELITQTQGLDISQTYCIIQGLCLIQCLTYNCLCVTQHMSGTGALFDTMSDLYRLSVCYSGALFDTI